MQEVFLKSSWFSFSGQKGKGGRKAGKAVVQGRKIPIAVAKEIKSMPGAGEGTSEH